MPIQESSFPVNSDQAVNQSMINLSLFQTGGGLAFGLIVLFAVGFSPMDVAHNAAHDTRHTLAFPCH